MDPFRTRTGDDPDRIRSFSCSAAKRGDQVLSILVVIFPKVESATIHVPYGPITLIERSQFAHYPKL